MSASPVEKGDVVNQKLNYFRFLQGSVERNCAILLPMLFLVSYESNKHIILLSSFCSA